MRARISGRSSKPWFLALVGTIAIAVLAGAIATASATVTQKTAWHTTIGTSFPTPRSYTRRIGFAGHDGAIRHGDTGCTKNSVLPAPDNSAEVLSLGFSASFYGVSLSHVFVNENGNLTFADALARSTPYDFTLLTGRKPIIAPFWADVDTSDLLGTGPYGAYTGGGAYDDQSLVMWGTGTLGTHKVFCALWPGVGGDHESSKLAGPLDSFQVLLIDRSDTGAGNFDIEFNYNHINWDTADSMPHSGSFTSAWAGWSSGNGHDFFKLAGSGSTSGAFKDGGADALSGHSRGADPFGTQAGRYYFQIRNERLTVKSSGGGHGTITSSPAAINCGSVCSTIFSLNRPVTLTAKPATGSTFTGWSGACTGKSTTCHVTMSAAKSVTAGFALETKTLTVRTPGAGDGKVTSSPPGISCGSDCSQSFTYGKAVTLTAKAATGSTFSGWSGDCSGKRTTCHVTMSAARSVVATFALDLETLSVTKSGRGTVTSKPAGVNCGSDCSGSYGYGTLVTLTATPLSGYVFSGWSGACSGKGSCKVSMTGNKQVHANFTQTKRR